MNRRQFAIAAGIMAVSATQAMSQAFPSRNITIVVPFSAGSGTDAVARLIGQELSTALKTGVVIENKAGANGSIAAQYVAKAPPDGYTLFMTTNTSHSANPSLTKNLKYDPIADFAAVTRTGNLPFMLVINPKIPATTVPEFIAYAKAHPNELTYGYGNSTGLVAGETLLKRAGITATKVGYKSTPPSLTDVIGGHISYMFVDLTSGLPAVKSGQVRALAVTTAERSAILPDLPSMKETGIADFDITSWNAIFVPAGTPKDVIATLATALRTIIDNPAIKSRFAEMGFDAFSSSPEELDAFVKQQLVSWAAMIREAGIEPE